ncbi:hypothetical protein Kpol_1054p15 [Vanderwaltozyma polyspora DSM 70294]|uniref:BHLH domain-containing protein n=1 Tax=Vanderwaltozyma polyspora (strain ATCC 22028 / DSM 70294 / BCRC 21397 / CBS 2163 / NBRC 10782 / NRRL Y-8283 / UCD 57-17) TaxID=436907 RepID=A7TIA2_VANPO|nr:uncharacterized protein Kpol_1054p15 [Vanderwaltozyma polyspora DSM 70294]EDO17968.1 hypothetical protein Kpol_1054p15 [Vanderwaltozyma polyspora DSM 70294]
MTNGGNHNEMNVHSLESSNDNVPDSLDIKKVRKPRGKRMSKLSESQIKINHVLSEKKRRELVRSIYDDLVDVVPDLTEKESRSEMIIYLKTINYLKWLYKRNAYLRSELIKNIKIRKMASK